jgi:carbon-monoxide dehydrogenase large subunit
MTVTEARPGLLVGARVARAEDPKLLTGRARFVDDIDLPGMLHAVVQRSPMAHARILSVDVSAALGHPGVHAVLVGEDLAARGVGEMAVTWVQPGQKSVSYPMLASDVVRYVGEAVAIVAADSRYVAEDAAELIDIEYEPLPVVVDAERALEDGAPLVHPEWGDNVVVQVVREAGDVDRAIAEAPVVVRERLKVQRYMAVPLETRGAVASPGGGEGELTLWLSTQGPHRAKTHLARMLSLPEHRIRVIAPDVGGGFGLKDHVYAEEALTALLAIDTGRPVKWIEDRQEHFVASVHAREQLHHIELAANEDGRILGVRDRFITDAGAHCSNVGVGPSVTTLGMLPGPYRFENYRAQLTAVATNKAPSGAYRGFGQTQATFVMERMMDRLARRLELDPAELRLRNLIMPEELPRQSPSGLTYDSGDYPQALCDALELIGYEGWRQRQRKLAEEGRRIGIGLGGYVEMTGMGPSREMGLVGFNINGYQNVSVGMDPQGRVTVRTGIASTGQGHRTTLAQICASELGVSFEDVAVVQGDTATTPYDAAGAIGSRTAAVGGVAVMLASRKVASKLRDLAAHRLEASPDDVELADGRLTVRGSPSTSLTVREVAEQAALAHDLPDGMTPGLEEGQVYDPEALTFSYAMHAAVVEVDAATGVLSILKYGVVHDCGTMINPSVVEGQILGGLAQGIGGALLEELVYDGDGQLLTTTFLDYLLPSAAEVPFVDLGHLEIPAPAVPGGFKGTGEGGAIAPPAILANAVEDALRASGAVVDRTPLSPSAIWHLANPEPAP